MARTSGDTWDIVTSVGFTALAVCAARALDAALDPPLANDPYAAGFVAAAGEPELVAAVAETKLDGPVGFNANWVGIRTRFFDNFFASGAESGIRQAVILAAGLDSRAYRLALPAGSTVFEVDQPRVLEFKQRVLDEQGAVPSARRVTVAVDLRDDWTGALAAADFDPARPTMWVLEGLLPYLPGAAQDALFEKLHELSVAGSRIAAELGPEPGEIAEFAGSVPNTGKPGTQPAVTDLWYEDPRRDTKSWLAERDWTVTTVDLMAKAAGEYGRPFHGLPPMFERFMRQRFFTAELADRRAS
jgi:methyltransferase (TIGR00027 family)